MKQAALDSPLDEWDHAVLEAVRRDDYSAPLRFGTVRTSEALLKLYCHGMIRRMEREPTFDEQERVQAWMDSAAFKQYADRLKRMMTGDVRGPIADNILARITLASYAWTAKKPATVVSCTRPSDGLTSVAHTAKGRGGKQGDGAASRDVPVAHKPGALFEPVAPVPEPAGSDLGLDPIYHVGFNRHGYLVLHM